MWKIVIVSIVALLVLAASTSAAVRPNPIREYGKRHAIIKPNPIREYKVGGFRMF